MRNVSTIVLGTLIVAVVGAYLVGQRLDARWAGGEGRVEPCRAINDANTDEIVSRGQIMSTPTTGFAKYRLCDGTLLYLDANTQIRLSEYRKPESFQETQLELIQGRVIIDGVADVHARNTVVTLRGAGCEFVHYSWLDQLDVTPFAELACEIKNPPGSPAAFQTTRFNTFDSSLVTITLFDPANSAASSFYAWTGLNLEPLR